MRMRTPGRAQRVLNVRAGHWESNASGATLLVYDVRHTRQLLLKNWCLDDCDNRSHGAAVCYPGTESEQCLFQSARVAF